jgi:hypothetical protein
MGDNTTDMTDECLRVFHGSGAYGWGLLKQQWPKAAVDEQRRKMAEVINLAQAQMREALEAVQAEYVLNGQLGEIVEDALHHV